MAIDTCLMWPYTVYMMKTKTAATAPQKLTAMKSPIKQTGNVGTNRIDAIKTCNAAAAKATAALAKSAAAKAYAMDAIKARDAVAAKVAPKFEVVTLMAATLATPKVAVQTAPTAKLLTSSLVSVSDIATELGMNPKTARAKMRRAQKNPKYAQLIDCLKAESGWSKVERDSANYVALVQLLS